MPDDNMNPDTPAVGLDGQANNTPGAGGDADPSQNQGTGNAPDGGSDDVAALKAQITELENRVSGQTKSWQKERDAKTKLEQKVKKYEDLGLDNFLDNDAQDQGDDKSAQANQEISSLKQTVQSLRVADLERNFATMNPDKAFVFQDPVLKEMVEITAAKEAQANPGLSDDDYLKKGVEKTVEHFNRIKEEGVKSATEDRQQIDDSGVNVGGGEKKKPSVLPDEDESYDTKSDYLKRQDTQNKMRGL